MICDSVSPLGIRLTSIEVQFPRFILPQMLMHRQWSRSCESLRARPSGSKLKEVETDFYLPEFHMNQKGMVAGEPLSNDDMAEAAFVWGEASGNAVESVKKLVALGVAKQWANRLLEPFAYQKMLVTATDFSNFFRLRCADDAQPEIQELACKMREALAGSTPTGGIYGYHLPYIERWEFDNLDNYEYAKQCSMARCARVSYTTHDGKKDLSADLKLATTLIESGHSNPAEHPCHYAPDNRRYANLKGWISYRYEMEQDGTLPNPEG